MLEPHDQVLGGDPDEDGERDDGRDGEEKLGHGAIPGLESYGGTEENGGHPESYPEFHFGLGNPLGSIIPLQQGTIQPIAMVIGLLPLISPYDIHDVIRRIELYRLGQLHNDSRSMHCVPGSLATIPTKQSSVPGSSSCVPRISHVPGNFAVVPGKGEPPRGNNTAVLGNRSADSGNK
ncbi:hypothetical protein PISL3812_10036 [Talaromyces islandicus]|uniref:Uncharacterized protein n=1 Tax=Talaromyces islandicus TaxID=28573 RepID=A0A0U1MBF5_TALIS|nr:hypothetical protein PISL3812_10036 [Talaromyces islandicus]